MNWKIGPNLTHAKRVGQNLNLQPAVTEEEEPFAHDLLKHFA
jgi:hypothetical protein